MVRHIDLPKTCLGSIATSFRRRPYCKCLIVCNCVGKNNHTTHYYTKILLANVRLVGHPLGGKKIIRLDKYKHSRESHY